MPPHPLFAHFRQVDVNENEFFVPYSEKVITKQYQDAIARLQQQVEAELRAEAHWLGIFSQPNVNEHIAKNLPRKMEAIARNPQYSRVGPYKLHVSLAQESYTSEIKNHIRLIIEKYSHTVFTYKCVNAEKLKSDLILLNEYITFLATLQNKESFSNTEKENFARIMRHHEDPKWATWKTITPQLIAKLTDSITKEQQELQKAHDRFLKGDQFTIYIPPTHDKTALLRLCQEINQYLTNQKLIPGATLKTERQLGKFINFRQEFLLQDFKSLYSQPNLFNALRISAHEDWDFRLNQVQAEMNASELFNYLSSNIDKPIPKDKWQAQWDKAQGTAYEKAVVLLLEYCGSFKDSKDKKNAYWGGTYGRFFKGRWGTNHGNEVQTALNQSTKTQSLHDLLDKLEANLKNKELKPEGDLRRILSIIAVNTDYGQIEKTITAQPAPRT